MKASQVSDKNGEHGKDCLQKREGGGPGDLCNSREWEKISAFGHEQVRRSYGLRRRLSEDVVSGSLGVKRRWMDARKLLQEYDS